MLPDLTHYPVNWVDGMKIARRHFTETDQFVLDHLRDAVALGLRADRYGLLPTPNELGSPAAFELLLSVDAQNEIQARLTQCRAVTAGGARIEITASSAPLTIRTSLGRLLAAFGLAATDGLRFSVVLTVNPFERVPTGPPDPAELPPRHPCTRPDYQLGIVPAAQLASQTSATFALVVGELLYADGALRPVAQYIPPSLALASHPALRADKHSPLADLVRELAEHTALALAQQLTTLRLLAPQQSPSYLLDALLRVAKQIKTSLDMLTEAEREELLKYCEQWSETPPATLLTALQTAVTLTYDHHRVHEHLQQQQQLWQLLGVIFRQLSQLEYIGKNREGWQTFINENPVFHRGPIITPVPESPTTGGGLRWSPI
jgi:hypothetical protein